MNKTKVYTFKAIGAMVILALLIFSTSGLGAPSIHLSNTLNNTVMYITTTRGNIYDAVGANIQIAVWSFNGTTGGEVHLPAGYFAINSLNITDKVTVIGVGDVAPEHWLWTGAGGTQLNVTGGIILSGGRLQNCKVYVAPGFSGTTITVFPAGGYCRYDGIHNVLSNIQLYNYKDSSSSPSGTGILIRSTFGGPNVTDCYTGCCTFTDITISGFKYGMYFDSIGSWINGNQFNNLFFNACSYGIYITSTPSGQVYGNTFNNLQFEGGYLSNVKSAIYLNGTASEVSYNSFDNVVVWDWNTANVPIVVKTNENYFSGYFGDDVNLRRINDTGNKNEFKEVESNSNYLTITPTGYHDGSKIYDDVNTLGDGGKVVFLPGIYDMDVSVDSDYFINYEACAGVIFNMSKSFSGTNMFVLKNNQTFRGPAILKGNNVSGKYGMVIEDNCLVCDLDFRNFNGDAVSFTGFNSTIQNCNFYNTTSYAMEFYYSDNNTVFDCNIRNNSDSAIYFGNSNNNRVLDSTFKKVKVDSTINITDTSVFNRISGNNIFASTIGVYVFDSTCNNNSIIDNSIYGATVAGLHDRGTDTYVSGNNFVKCTKAIELSSGSSSVRPVIRDNPGYVTENWGTSNATSVAFIKVTHGLASTPTCVIVTQRTGTLVNYKVNQTTTTYFCVKFTSSTTGDFYWYAKA